MKLKKMALLTIMVFVLAPAVAWGFQINDTTLVQPFQGAVATGGAFTDVLGDSNIYNTFGANFNSATHTLSIFTNYHPSKDGNFTPANKTADLFLHDNPTGLNFAVRLDTLTGTGEVFELGTFNTSVDIFKTLTNSTGTLLTYGGMYDQASPKLVPVFALTAPITTTPVVWHLGAGGLNNEVDINVDGLTNFSFVWGTATCANDVIAGNVPIPPSALLLGSGLLGLVGFGWRRKQS